MKFTNLVKGRAAETLVKTLLESVGYRVVSFGVEEQLREIKQLSYEEYSKLNLPEQIKKMPDLIVTDSAIEKFWMFEVKYRSFLNSSNIPQLFADLKAQLKLWPDLHAILIRGDVNIKDDTQHPILIRIITPTIIEKFNEKDFHFLNKFEPNHTWTSLISLHRFFEPFLWSTDIAQPQRYKHSNNANILTKFMVQYLSSVNESTDDK